MRHLVISRKQKQHRQNTVLRRKLSVGATPTGKDNSSRIYQRALMDKQYRRNHGTYYIPSRYILCTVGRSALSLRLMCSVSHDKQFVRKMRHGNWKTISWKEKDASLPWSFIHHLFLCTSLLETSRVDQNHFLLQIPQLFQFFFFWQNHSEIPSRRSFKDPHRRSSCNRESIVNDRYTFLSDMETWSGSLWAVSLLLSFLVNYSVWSQVRSDIPSSTSLYIFKFFLQSSSDRIALEYATSKSRVHRAWELNDKDKRKDEKKSYPTHTCSRQCLLCLERLLRLKFQLQDRDPISSHDL